MNKHAERRSSLRRPIHHEAIMMTEDGVELNCIIADFCLDGMFIKFLPDASNRQLIFPDTKDRHSIIELSFTGDKGQTNSINAEVVHSIQGACGLHFIKRYDDVVQSLANLSVNSGISTNHSASVQNILDECIQFINTTFGPLLEDFWGILEEELRSEAIKASSDQQANALMALAEKIKQRHNDLQHSVMQSIADPMAAFSVHLEKRKAMSDRLSVIDKTEFEDWLVSRVLVMRCEADYQSLLMPLKLRLDALGVGDKCQHQSVFGPALLVNAFQPVVQSLIVDSAAEKLIFRVFEQKVMLLLNGLYEGLNTILIRHNILPKLKLKQLKPNKIKQKVASSPSSKPLDSSTRMNAPKVEEQDIAETLNELVGQKSQSFTRPPFSTPSARNLSEKSFAANQQVAQSALSNISHLLRNLRTQAASQTSEHSGELKESYTPLEFDEGLAELQANTGDIDWNDAPRSLIERVQDHLLSSGDEKEIDEEKKAAIDVVDRFFLSMRSNPRISSEAKQYLLKLEVPVLKVLLKDERFFEDHQSSVRAVMNRIAQLGAKGSKLNPASREKVAGLVNKIVREFEGDTAIFDTVLTELDALLDRQNNLYVKNVERVAAAAEGTHKVEEANVAVATAINERIAHKFVPSAVVTLINEGWKEYLNLMFIKFGDNSEQWQEALSVIDRLIAYGDDPRIPIDIKVILPKIQEGLKSVSGNNEASLNVRDALKAFILNAPKGMHLSEQAQQHKVPESEEDLVQRNINKSQVLKDWIIKIKTIPLGTWLTFKKADEDITYMRLVWVAKGYSKFVFVNHQGRKVVELGLFKLANYFKEGRIGIDTDYELPIVNQGLDNMVKDVYDKIAYESSHDVKTGLINKTEFCRQVRLLMKKGKRTSECSLLFIRFQGADNTEPKLTEDFTKQVVETLETISVKDNILGRINDIDFVIFSVVKDGQNFRNEAQEALIGLCQKPANLAFNLRVVIGESRAHLGFNNPSAMIQHALDAFENTEGSEGDLHKSEEQSEAKVDQKETAPVILLDEAANTEVGAAEFDDLVFQLWGQNVSKIAHDEGKLYDSIHLNLLNAIQGDNETYSAENEECALKLDKWWIKTLLKLKETQAHLFNDYEKIRVQLSSFALNSDEITDQLIGINHRGELDASKICFDLYDCFQIQDAELSAMRMNRLKQAGYSFCLDHFGSERSPFSYLKILPVDMIKIDDAFITELNKEEHENDDDVAADSIVEIAHYMGKTVLATGVDSAVCLQKMKHLKIDFVQGSTISELKKYDI